MYLLKHGDFLVLATYMFPFDINLATGHQLIHEELVLLVHGFLRDWRHRCRQLLSSMGSADRISDESPSPDGRKYLKILVQEDSEVVVSN